MSAHIQAAMSKLDELAYGKWEDMCEIARFGVMAQVLEAGRTNEEKAAPELLEALKAARSEIWRLLDVKGVHPKEILEWPEIKASDAAIAKAEAKS